MGKSGAIETRHYLTCLWPGLAELWWRGRLAALPAAIVFGIALNLLMIVRFLYPQWLSGLLVTMACWVGLAAWAFYVLRSVKELPNLIAPREASEEPDRFEDAQFAYLQGDWSEAERLLLEVLSIDSRDPPAFLMLSSTYRQTNRPESAQMLMQELTRMEIADTWKLEIEAEMARIRRDTEAENENEESSNQPPENEDSVPADLTAA